MRRRQGAGAERVWVGALCFSRGLPEFGKSDGRTADPSASLGMTILFGNATYSFQDELSSRPERTRISCHAALDKGPCAPFCKGKAHEVHQRQQVPQEIRGSVVALIFVAPQRPDSTGCGKSLD
jgi:hypothetical protein